MCAYSNRIRLFSNIWVTLFVCLQLSPSISADTKRPVAPETISDGRKLTYEKVRNLINKHKIRDIKTLLSILPESYRSHYTLMYDSRSTQDASPRHPRVILYGEDAKLIMGFNGHPSQAGFDKLELIQFRDKENDFEFREITFPTRSNKKTRVEFSLKNPNSCRNCHRKDLHPNWEEYSFWKGAYGSNDDNIRNTDEINKFKHYQKNSAHTGRYAHLRPPEGSPITPYSVQTKGDQLYRPNLVLSELLARLLAKSISEKMKKTPNGKALRFLFLISDMCVNKLKEYKKRKLRMEKLLGSYSDFLRKREIIRKAGFNNADLTLRFENTYKSYNFWYFSGEYGLDTLIQNEIFRDLASNNPSLKELYLPHRRSRGALVSPKSKHIATTINSLGGDSARYAVVNGKDVLVAAAACPILWDLFDQTANEPSQTLKAHRKVSSSNAH